MSEEAAEIVSQRIEPDVLDGQDRLMTLALFASAGSFSDVDPVGGLIAGAAMAWGFDEGFEEQRAITVSLEPIVGQLPLDD